MWINYPNNPTAALAPPGFFERVVAFAQKTTSSSPATSPTARCTYEAPPPFVPGDAGRARGRHRVPLAVEDLQHDRLARRLGVRQRGAGRRASAQVKTNVDSGVFEAVQRAAIAALSGDQAPVARQRAIYQERRDVLCGGLTAAGFDVLTPKASFYTLVANPKGLTSIEFAARLLTEAGIVATPATGFGPSGEGLRAPDGLRRQGAPRRGGPAARRPEALTICGAPPLTLSPLRGARANGCSESRESSRAIHHWRFNPACAERPRGWGWRRSARRRRAA